jgi:hypothetical protein
MDYKDFDNLGKGIFDNYKKEYRARLAALQELPSFLEKRILEVLDDVCPDAGQFWWKVDIDCDITLIPATASGVHNPRYKYGIEYDNIFPPSAILRLMMKSPVSGKPTHVQLWSYNWEQVMKGIPESEIKKWVKGLETAKKLYGEAK